MSAAIRCVFCSWRSLKSGEMAAQEFIKHRCFPKGMTEPTDEQLAEAFIRLLHPSLGGDAA
jgi:hypothetical protein